MTLQMDESAWVELAKKEHPGLFSELDTLLRGLIRFFTPEHLPMKKGVVLAVRDFHRELTIVRDVIFRCLGIIERVIPERHKNAFWFQKYAEQSLLSDQVRDLLKRSIYKQDTPEKALLYLYDSLVNTKVLVQGLLNNERISYTEFLSTGEVIENQIRENLYFDPFKKSINPELDKIRNKKVSAVVRGISNKTHKKIISSILLAFFRCLRFLGHIDTASYIETLMNCAIAILVQVRSELKMLEHFIETQRAVLKDESLDGLLSSIKFQLSMESKRVFEQELKDVLEDLSANKIKGRIENAHGILRNMIEQMVLQIVQYYEPEIDGSEIFPGFMTRVEQSLKLREDLYVLHALISTFEKNLTNKEKRIKALESLQTYMLYFQSLTFKLLRHDDYEEFERFFNRFFLITPKVLEKKPDTVAQQVNRFKIFIETTIKMVSQRQELRDHPVDKKKLKKTISQFVPTELTK